MNFHSQQPYPMPPQQPPKSSTRKRAPKAPTMSPERWKPCEERIKQLWVHGSCSIEHLQETINKEFGLKATRRQYLAQLETMRIKRNVKAKERTAIIQHIDYRVRKAGKKNSRVRVRGHTINNEKLDRWAKEITTNQQLRCTSPTSPLPSDISIYTNSPRGSPTLMLSSLPNSSSSGLESMSSKAMRNTLVQRLLAYAQTANHIIQFQEAQTIFNDMQFILSCKRGTCEKHRIGAWNPNLENDITRLRNLINIDLNQKLVVDRECNNLQERFLTNINGHPQIRPPQRNHRFASWKTLYYDVVASFWTTRTAADTTIAGQDATVKNEEHLAARLALIPKICGRTSLRVVCDFDFTPNIDPFTKITYQAMIPNDSEVFTIVASGDVTELIELLESGRASLADRDEQGRSLLNYAMCHTQVAMCRFLVGKNADIDSIELTCRGYLCPIHSMEIYNEAEMDDQELDNQTSCLKIMLEAGADPSAQMYVGDGQWQDAFKYTIDARSTKALRHILDLGEPFVNSRSSCKEVLLLHNYEYPPLILLADQCGYIYGTTLDVVDKAILLIQRKADILCRHPHTGNAVLHTILGCERKHETTSRRRAHRGSYIRQYDLSMTEPMDLLIVFITAGADVYAANDQGITPSTIAIEYNREEEWIKALETCGYDAEEVLKQPDSSLNDPKGIRQTSKLSFEEYCQRRSERLRFEAGLNAEREDDENNDEDDEYSEDDDIHSDTTECECDPEWAESDVESPSNDGRHASTTPNSPELVHDDVAQNFEDIEECFHDMSMGARHAQVPANEYNDEGFGSTHFDIPTLFADDLFNLSNDKILDFQNQDCDMYDVSGEQSDQEVINVVSEANPDFNSSLTGELLDLDNILHVEIIDYSLQEQDNTKLNDQEVMAGYGGDYGFQEMDFTLESSLTDDVKMLEEFVEFETMVNF